MPQIRKEAELFALLVLAAFCCMPALAAGTNEVQVVKYAIDGVTVVNETTVNYSWMEGNLPVYGDDVTEWYLQGPVYPIYSSDRWNPAEDQNLKNWGRNKGTDVKDLCDLVGGAESGETIRILANDGLGRTFPYGNVYSPDPRQGRMIVAWWYNDTYVPTFDSGIRLLFLADTSTNPYGYHCYGVWDMNQTLPPEYYYFNYEAGYGGDALYPSTTGLSVKWVDRIYIYSNDPVPLLANFTANTTSGIAPLSVQFTDASAGGPSSFAWDFNNDGIIDDTSENPVWTYNSAGIYTVNLTVGNGSEFDSEIKTNYITVSAVPPTIIFNGTVTLLEGNFTWMDSSAVSHEIQNLTPHGALEEAYLSDGFTYGGGWSSGKLTALLDWIDNGSTNYTYIAGPPKVTWNYQLNGIYQNYNSATTGVSNLLIGDGDYIEFYYGPNQTTTENATAIIRLNINVPPPPSTVDVIYNGTVTLTPGETFNVTAYNSGTDYTINRTTPLGALDEVAMLEGFVYNVTDKRWSSDQVLLLDDVNGYIRNTPGNWLAYINNVYKDGYGNHADGLNVIELASGDHVDFYYATGVVDQTNLTETISKATAAVLITAEIEGSPPSGPDWSLSLSGARSQSVTKSYFEQGLACPSSGHMVNWTDSDGSVWSGIPLWLLVGMVDDNPDIGPDHYNFNDSLAAQGYSVKVTAGDGYNTTLASADIARNNGYIVANKLNGTDLPLLTPGGKLSWPLHLKGSAVFGGQQVGNITSIELTGMPQPSQGWTLTLEGDVVDLISQEYFEEAIACHHNVTYTDASGSIWTGVPLWDLVGAVDDIETGSHWTFNDTRANVTGYTVRVIAADGYNRTFPSLNVSHNTGFIVANTLNGTPLSGTNGHLKLVGPATTSSGQRVSNITIIRLEGLPSYPAGEYSLSLKGKISDVITQPELEEWIAANTETYTDGSGNEYSGIPLWRILAWVDDRIPAGSNAFNDATAAAGYKVIVKAGDGYSKEFLSGPLARSNDYIVANTLNGSALPNDGSHPPWPLRLVGAGATGSSSVGNIVEIELTDFNTVQTAAPVHIIKYGPDGVTIVNETNVTYQWMEANLPVIGDGTTVYKFEAITSNTSNIWDPEETYPGGFKIANAVKGSRLHDLCELVGGMGTGTDIKLVANDGYETTLPYSSVYTNPAVQARQGDAILAWWADGQYVPYYSDGMRLFFMPGDHIYGQWDMNQTLPANYHHFYYQDSIFYPSCAGLSAKYITTIKIYSEPAADWTIELDGRDIGGVNATISKTYFEQALACQFGANHSVTYTDSSGRVWGGMPLWFLCGFVDDADQHSNNAYNEAKALAGYNITITGSDGYNYTFDSRDTVRNANYIVANTLNSTPIPESDSSWPLRMAGQNVSGGKVVKKIVSIRLIPSSQTTVSVVPATVGLPIDTTQEVQLVASSLPQGLAGYELVVSLENPGSAQIVGVSYPAWAIVSNTTSLPASSVKISAVDLNKSVQAGALNVLLATITLRGIDSGSTPIVLSGVTMDADGGGVITPVLLEGQADVYSEITANFTANRTTGMASENVTFAVGFTCLSTGNPAPSAWHWEFGNGAVSSLEDPVCSYNAPGEYAVTLNVSNAYTSDSLTRDDYIIITPYVEAFPGYTNPPTTTGMTDDYLIYDINGNGRLDFDDVVVYYQNMQWIRDNTRVGIKPYDYNQNGRIDFDDVVLLYDVVLSA
jgi:PKD repeat protein